MAQELKVLIVEDNELDAALLLRELKRSGFEPTSQRVETADTMIAAIKNETWDIVISDYNMPVFSAPAALKVVKDSGLDLPFIVVSGTVSEQVAVEVMRAGARDFIAKGHLIRLGPVIVRELSEAQARVRHRATDRQLSQAQKMEAVGQLTGGLAHDFNNILMVIMANVDALDDELSDGLDPRQREYLTQISGAAQRASELTRQLLAFSRQQALKVQVTNLNKVIEVTSKLLGRALGEHIRIELKLAPKLWSANVDQAQFESALLNLCVNARDAMSGGGDLVIETSNMTLDEQQLEQNPDAEPGPHVMVSVTDTGSGIAKEIIDKVFEPFFTTKEVGKGTGLGLSMVYGFIRQSKGHIGVESTIGKGTTFKLYLPRYADEVEVAVAPKKSDLPGGDEHILLVEDDPQVRQSVVRQLRSLGYGVTEADSGDAGLAIVEAAHQRFNLLLTDMVMPGKVNGMMLVREVQARWSGIRTVVMSGYTEDTDVLEGRRDDGIRLLVKPFRKAELARVLREALDVQAT